MDDGQFRQLLCYFDRSWQGYRRVRKGVMRRLSRHLAQLGVRSLGAYLERLESSPEAREECRRLLEVSISRFFRDRRLWQVLEGELLPRLIRFYPEKIRIWCAGCACGEEACSLAIIWKRLEERGEAGPELELTASDANEAYLDRARAGIYGRSSLKEVPEEILRRFFEARKGGKHYEVKPSIRHKITWVRHDLLDRPPLEEAQIILLRNSLLTYYRENVVQQVLPGILSRLSPGGLFIIGAHERLPARIEGLDPHPLHPCIFQKRD